MKTQTKCTKNSVKQLEFVAVVLCIIVCVSSFSAIFPSLVLATSRPTPTPTPTPTPSTTSFSLSSASQVKPADVILEMSYSSGGGGPWTCYGPSTPFVPTGNPETIYHYSVIEPMDKFIVAACGWKNNEQVELAIWKPDGKKVTVQLTSRPDISKTGYAVSYEFTHQLNDKVGTYYFKFSGISGSAYTQVTVRQPSGARLYWLNSRQILLYQFRANERVRLFAYKSPTLNTWRFWAWQEFFTNTRGELLLSDGMGADDYIVVGDKSGEVHFRNPEKKWMLAKLNFWALSITKPRSDATFCYNPPPTRLRSGMKVRVAYTNGLPLNVRDRPSTSGKVIEKFPEGTVFTILDGPICAQDMYWWKIELASHRLGYVAEGDARQYFIEPWR